MLPDDAQGVVEGVQQLGAGGWVEGTIGRAPEADLGSQRVLVAQVHDSRAESALVQAIVQAEDGRIQPTTGPGHQAIPEDTPLTCWRPIQPGLTPHGLRHSHKTWMAEDGIPEILAEQRLGHQVPGMRGLYAHASTRMRDDLKAALQARWEDSLHAQPQSAHTHQCRCSTNCWHPLAPATASRSSRGHHERPNGRHGHGRARRR